MATHWLVMMCLLMVRCSNASFDLDQQNIRVDQQQLVEENHLLWENLGIQPYNDDDNKVNVEIIKEKLLIKDNEGPKNFIARPRNVDLNFFKSTIKKSIRKKKHEAQQHINGGTVDEENRSWRRPRRTERSVQNQDEVEAACECVRTQCHRREEFGPVIIRGECYNSITKHRGQRSADPDYELPPPIFETEDEEGGMRCAGDRPLILLSSGHRSRLSLSDVPEVLVCPGSLAPYLQQLIINRVPQVKVGRGSLQPRHMGFTLSVTGSGMNGKLILPEDGLKVDTGEVREYGSELTGVLVEAEADDVKPAVIPMEVKVEVRNVSGVHLDGRSVVAPSVSVLIEGATLATFASNAIIPYSTAEVSSLNVSATDHITLGSRSAAVGMFIVQKVGKLHIQGSGIHIINLGNFSEGGLVDIREVSELVLEESAINYPRGGSLYMQNVLVNHAGRRAVTTGTFILPLPLLTNVTLKHVVFENSDPIAFCLPALYAALTDLVVLRGVGVEDEKAVCVSAAGDLHTTTVRDVTGDSAVASAVVACTSQQPSLTICHDPLCLPCHPTSPTEVPTSAAVTNTSEITEVSSQVITSNPPDDATTTTITTTTNLNTLESLSAERDGLPPYVLPLLLVSTLVILALFTYCVYKIHKRGKQAEYKVPRTTPRQTFPCTIVTRDTLNTPPTQSRPANCLAPSHHPCRLQPHRTEMYVGFNANPPQCPEDNSSIQDSYGSERASVASQDSYPSHHHSSLATPTCSPQLRTNDLSADQTSSVGNSQDLPPYGYY
ncbi:hypothetical protein Pcinc_014014 [Petrolisthes cinctipes]|uniref:Uncharacterized protein n=1 Tax=Petrolisthes cinctipes TaxID=88211 RepID=A0AAE1KS66_PETCI|nr:hypothetical protein Pcinc_014014 [Petrolisthes cinctipes]